MNENRLAMLDAVEKEAHEEPLELEAILRAFLAPDNPQSNLERRIAYERRRDALDQARLENAPEVFPGTHFKDRSRE